MKLTLTEVLGLAAAVIVGTTMSLAAQGGSPPAAPNESSRRALERVAESVAALPDGDEATFAKVSALHNIAQGQLKLGDRAGAVATFRVLDRLGEHTPAKRLNQDRRRVHRLFAQVDAAELRSEAGDREGARASLIQAARILEEACDAGAIREAFERMTNEIEAGLVENPNAPRVVHDRDAAMACEVSMRLIPPASPWVIPIWP